jgi:hypothetical protein
MTGRRARFAPVVRGTVDLPSCAALARPRKLLSNRLKQGAAIGLDDQGIIAAALEHRLRKAAVAMQRIGGDNPAFQAQKLKHLRGSGGLVAAGRLMLRQSHPRFHRKNVDQMQRRCLGAALIGAAQRLSVDRHHATEFEPVGLGKTAMNCRKARSNAGRLEQTENPAERVVARDAMLQAQEKPATALASTARTPRSPSYSPLRT